MAILKPKRSRKKQVDSKLAIIFGENVKRERERLGKSQIELAESVGSSGTYIGLIERAQTAVTLPKMEKICNKLGKDVSYMLRGH
jgi:transcriptional regulator with XRE-family HTH domain